MDILTDSFAVKQDSFLKRYFSLWAVVYVFAFILTSQGGIQVPFYNSLILWVGKDLLAIPNFHRITMTGSGDTTYDYVLLLVNVMITFILSVIISIADYKRKNYRQLYLFAIVVVRYYVAFILLSYGFSKIFNGQFPSNSYFRLEEKVGDMSPMGMLWTFMGASRSYTFVSGLLEVIGGTLLLFRKTKTFGALFVMTVMLNVVLLNFTYDVPVKIYSTNLVLLCVFILSYDWIRLWHFFLNHRTETLEYNKLYLKKKWMQISLRIIKVLLIVVVFYNNIHGHWHTLTVEHVPMSGAYLVQSFILNKDTLQTSDNAADSVGWSQMILDYPKYVRIKYNNGKMTGKIVLVDTTNKTFQLTSNDFYKYAFFHYYQRKDTVTFRGDIMQDSAQIVFVRKQMKDYLLVNRGFHWINEYPFNR